MAWAKPSKSTTARGYGAAHQRERKRWAKLIAIGGVSCYHCGTPLTSDMAWHLDHTADRSNYRGAACASCNIRDGAIKGNRKSRGLSAVDTRTTWVL